MTPQEELEDAAAQLLDASHTEKRERFSGAPAWTRFAEEGYFARLANAVRRVRGDTRKEASDANAEEGAASIRYPQSRRTATPVAAVISSAGKLVRVSLLGYGCHLYRDFTPDQIKGWLKQHAEKA